MSTTSVPPRFVPTLTDVVQPATRSHEAQFEHSTPANTTVAPIAQAHASNQASDTGSYVPTGDLLIQHVMQQVDMVLERRLREALGRVILEQTANLAPKLRYEIEEVVKKTVAQALAQELARQ